MTISAGNLTSWDKSLLAKHLSRYKNLENGTSVPISSREKHFVRVFKHGDKPVTQHEIAYLRYKQSINVSITTSKQELNPISNQLEETIDFLDEELISQGGSTYYNKSIENIKTWYTRGTTFSSSKVSESLVWLNFLVAESSLSKSLERFSAENFNTISNEYTKAIDGVFAEGLKSGKEYISPSLHRLIIEGHTLPDAFLKVRDALPDDTLLEEIKGTLTSLASDMSSVVGLPVTVLGKEYVETITNTLNTFGISENKFADLMSLNTVELISSIIPALALILSWSEADTEKFCKIVGALGVTSLYAGNPISLIIVLVGLAKSFQKSKKEQTSSLMWAKSLSKGSLVSTVAIVSMNLLGPVVWTTFVVAIISISIFRSYKISVDIDGLSNWISDNIKSLLKNYELRENR